MVHTLPDYTSKWKTSTIADIVDPGEAVCRLGSIDTFDRRGNVIFLDDFENLGNSWRLLGDGTGSDVVLSAEFPFTGSQAFKLTAGSDGNKSARIRRYFALPTNTSLGTEWCFTFDGDTDYIRLLNIYFDGTTQWQAVIKLSLTDGTITVDDATLGDTVIASGLTFLTVYPYYNHIKFVVDFTTHKYVRVIYNNHTYDASNYDLDFGASANPEYMYVDYRIYGDALTNSVGYIDNCILTQNEV